MITGHLAPTSPQSFHALDEMRGILKTVPEEDRLFVLRDLELDARKEREAIEAKLPKSSGRTLQWWERLRYFSF